jgi:hypothetical protein
MTRFFFLYADLDKARDLLDKRARSSGGFDTMDTIVILGFMLLLVLVLFAWAYFIRKRPRDYQGARALLRSRQAHRSRHGSREASGDSPRRVRVRRRRRRRSEDLPRNPTLGETGGLPPLRPEESDASSEAPSPRPQT